MSGYWLDRLDLPGEQAPGQPLIEIVGNERVLIEHHFGVTEYGCHCICVKVRSGLVYVQGRELVLSRMTRQMLVISGCIETVRLERRG